MLTKEQNDLVTRTSKGTPLGDLMRRYWVPAFLSREIPEPDCPPVQVRILGEELVAFRDTQGRIGLLGEHCAHRGTSLFYGRNEECGLRCIYHGWKYDVEGNVLETPAEPAGSTFASRLRHTSYPTREVNGIVFAYLGPEEKKPIFPAYEWTQVAKAQTYVTKAYQECSWLQGLEGECDSSHLSFLHRVFKPGGENRLYSDGAVEYEAEETDYGVRLIASRNAPQGGKYVRLSAFIMPVGVAVPVSRNSYPRPDGYEVHLYTPIDDEHSWRFDFGFRRSRDVVPEDVHRQLVIDEQFRRIPNRSNGYLQDREMQRNVNFTGMEDFLTHDSCATESMGPRYDRSSEHLGASDKGVAFVRRYLLDAIKTFQSGEEPPHLVYDAELNDWSHCESTADVFEGHDWRTHWPYHTRTMRENLARLAGAATR